jgi:energy-coupling factor transport system permease protein
VTTLDPYAEAVRLPGIRFLHQLNPLAKIAGPLPAMVLLIFARDVATPLALLLFALVILLVGARLRPAVLAGLLLGAPAAVLVLSLSFGLWTDQGRIDAGSTLFGVGDYRFTSGMWSSGLATALRLAALVVLSLLAGLTSTGPELVRAMVQQLRVPYRIGYTALAAFRFVPRFGHELEVIRSAHRVRGMAGGRGPFAGLRRYFGYVVPLLAGAIRHAERVALAMDARAFGAHATRTERHIVPFRTRDLLFILLFWAATALAFLLIPRLELP